MARGRQGSVVRYASAVAVAGVFGLLAPMATAIADAGPPSPASSAKLAGNPNAWVAYQAFPWVRLVHPDGTGDHILTEVPGPGSQEHPDWSPDGRRLVMDVDFHALWVVDVDSTGESTSAREVYSCEAPCAFIQDGAWSPDGKEIAFLRYSQSATNPELADPPQVVGLNIDTGQEHILYTSPKPSDSPFSPRWSPDGRQLVIDEALFASDRLDEGEIVGERVVVVSADGSNARRELFDLAPGIGTSVDWGRNGRIVTTTGGNLWTMKPNGTQLRQITNYDGVTTHAVQPTWTPAGNAVVFTYVLGQFDGGEHPTLGFTGPNGRPTTVWSAQDPIITHPRLQPTRQGGPN
jgi:Tol biopolymer transport system component